MKKSLTLLLTLSFLHSCITKQENNLADHPSSRDTIAPLQVTVLVDLPDSLQAKTFALDTIPAPKVNRAGSGETKSLAVLQNEKGEPVLDPEGKPFVLGGGGKSNFTNFTTDNGLALDAVNCSIKDQYGNLWFGTHGGGVSRYDGKSFTNFTTAQGLPNNAVLCIVEDRKGNIWFGTGGGGVSRYDGKSFTNYTTANGLAHDIVWSMAEDKNGNLWFGTNGSGVSRYDGKSFTTFTSANGLAYNYVYSITADKNGILWFGTELGISSYDGKSFTGYPDPRGPERRSVASILEDRSGNLWFGTDGGGVCRYDGKSFSRFTTAQGLANNMVISIKEDKSGDLWFGTKGGGVSRYDGKSFTSFNTGQGLANNFIFSITEDNTGNLWFGTGGGGISCYHGRSFTSFTTNQGMASNDVWSITEDKNGNRWIGSEEGVCRYDGRSFTRFTMDQGLAENTIYSIAEDQSGNLWFGSGGGGVSRFDGKSFTNYTAQQGLAHIAVYSIAVDKAGNLWFGTKGGGVSRFDGHSFTNYTTKQGLGNNFVYCITEDQTGKLWFGTEGGGVSRYDGKSFTSITTAQGLSSNTVLSITEDKTGYLWVGTDDGLNVLKVDDVDHHLEGKGKAITGTPFVKRFGVSDGLPDNVITHVKKMTDGKMAVGTNFGITLCRLSADGTKLTDIEIYNANTGYPVKDVNMGQNAMLLDSKGLLWACTGSEKTALVRFDPAALHKHTAPPALFIQAIKVNDENICWYNLQTKGIRKNQEDSAAAMLQEFLAYGKTLSTRENDAVLERFGNIQFDGIRKFYPVPENLVLPYEHNQIAFDFTAIETDRPFLVKYQYMLEGYDKNWSPVSGKSNANFGNINEGTYTFKVKAQGANGVWSQPITYRFKVLPPWYRTWWAYVLDAALFLLALRFFIKWRERKLVAEKEKLEKTVEERTAEVVREKNEADKQRKRSDDLLLNILPEEVAEELKTKGEAEARLIEEVTVLFTDFKGFTALSEKLTPKELVQDLHECFTAFDNIMQKHGLEKIKTIGDAYMAAGGLPTPNSTHATDVVKAALEIKQFMEEGKARKIAGHQPYFEIRIGVHTGPVVAGIVGVKKFSYDIWGDTVNTASRMESSGEAGKVNISQTTYELTRDNPGFVFEHRGKVSAKGKGEIDMYFVEGKEQRE